MTYCLGMLLDEGLILMADTRTNAGVDNFSTYRKLHALIDEPERQIFVATAGNLSVSQSVVSLLREALETAEDISKTLAGAPTMFRAAQMIGDALRTATGGIFPGLPHHEGEAGADLLIGGRIGSTAPKLYLVYQAGNFIECETEVPFFQIGETKYGRPILDRIVRSSTTLSEAVKIGFLSFDSCMRSNLGVAPPIDLMIMPADPDAPVITRRIEKNDAYFADLSKRWSAMLLEATRAIPDPPFMSA